MKQKIPHSVWDIPALFFFAWFLTSGWLLWDGDTSAVVRFAFAYCGSLWLFAGHRGGLSRGMKRLYGWLGNKRLRGWSAALCCILLVAALLAPIFLHLQKYAWSSGVSSDLKAEGIRLLEYAEAHNDTLPQEMGRGAVYRSIEPTANKKNYFREPFVWCGELGGLRLSDIDQTERVVVAYAREQDGARCPVLYLDGHVKMTHNRKQLRELLRERPNLLVDAHLRKAEREAKEVNDKSRANLRRDEQAIKGEQYK